MKYLLTFLLVFLPLTSFGALSDNLVGYWACEETSGARADSTDNNNDLTDNNTVGYATGKIDNACDFERDNSEYLSISDASQTGLDITGDFSTCFWGKFESSTYNQGILGKYDTANQRSYGAKVRGSDVLFITTSNGSSVLDASESSTYSLATWYYYCFTYDVSASTGEWYKNASSLGTDNTLTTSIFNGSSDFKISAIDGDYTDGLLDEIAIWSRLLSSAEITELYNSGAGVNYNYINPPVTMYSCSGASCIEDAEGIYNNADCDFMCSAEPEITATTTQGLINTGDELFALAIITFLLTFIFLGLLFNTIIK